MCDPFLGGTASTLNTGGYNVTLGLGPSGLELANNAVTKAGAGTLTLVADQSGSIARNASWTVNGGTLLASGVYSSAIALGDGKELGASTGNVLNLDAGSLLFTATGGAGFFSARTVNVSANGGAISDGGFAPGQGSVGNNGGNTISPTINIAAGAGLDLVSTGVLDFDAGNNGTGAGLIGGAGGVTVYGTGRAEILSTNNTYLGGTTVTAGATLVIGGPRSLGTGGSYTVTRISVRQGSAGTLSTVDTLNLTNGTILTTTSNDALVSNFFGTGTATLGNAVLNISGGAQLIHTSSDFRAGEVGGTQVINISGTGFGLFQNSATHTLFIGDPGSTVVNQAGGTIATAGNLTYGNNNDVPGAGGATYNLGNGTAGSGLLIVGAAIAKQNAGTPAVLNFNGGTLPANSSNAWLIATTISTNILAGGATINTGGNNPTIAAALLANTNSPGGGLAKLGTGTLTLTGANTYACGTTVTAGTLATGTTGTTGTLGTGTVTVGTATVGATLTLSNGTSIGDSATPVFGDSSEVNLNAANGTSEPVGGLLDLTTNQSAPARTYTAAQLDTLFNDGVFGSANGETLTAAPEPTSLLLVGAAARV